MPLLLWGAHYSLLGFIAELLIYGAGKEKLAGCVGRQVGEVMWQCRLSGWFGLAGRRGPCLRTAGLEPGLGQRSEERGWEQD